jgi:glycosyltransferase involved in cell wall biosynthesis
MLPFLSALRVLFVCGADFSAPSEKQALGYADALIRQGHAVAISIAGDPASLGPATGGGIEGLRVWRHRIVGQRPSSRALAQASAFDPTVIHAFNLRHPVACAARAYATETGAPVFVHFEDDEWGLAGGYGGEPLRRRLARAIRAPAGAIHAPSWPYALTQDFRWAATEATALDALTPALSAHVTARLGRPCKTLLPPLPYGRGESGDDGLRLPAELDGRPLVGYTGAIFGVHEADFRLGLLAIAEVRRRGEDVALVHAGRVARRFDVLRLAREAGLERDAVWSVGALTPAPLHDLLNRVTVLMQPGHPNEFNRLRLPSKLQVYLASGTPTVTFAVGAGELLVDRTEVLKTYGGDPAELADRITELLRDPELRRELSAGGRLAAARLFDADRNAAELVEHYRRAQRDSR